MFYKDRLIFVFKEYVPKRVGSPLLQSFSKTLKWHLLGSRLRAKSGPFLFVFKNPLAIAGSREIFTYLFSKFDSKRLKGILLCVFKICELNDVHF